MSRRMAADPQWQRIARHVFACGLVMTLMFVVMGALAVPDDAPLHPWFGLLQRLVLVVWFPCTILVSIRLLRVANAAGEPNRLSGT